MYYTIHALPQILNSVNPMYVKKDGNYIMNEAISFDIETTSMRKANDEKFAFMYIWMFDIFDKTIVGRTWGEFLQLISEITTHFNLSGVKRRIIVYVHNLAYEFQFIRKLFKWEKVFSLSRRKPLYALTKSGVEFRCSYKLSGYKLEKIGEQIGIEKLPDFDYSKIRHSRTILTPREIEYCIHDVKIVSAYIRQKIVEENNNISTIPLTKTGYVRRYVREHTIKGNNRCFYKNMIRELTLEPDEYIMAKRAFAGGFTHASVIHSGEICDDVTSYDFGSSYPTVLIAEKYPMTKGVELEPTLEEFYDFMAREECCMFTIELENVEQIFPAESYISESRCTELENATVNNGRIVRADRLIIDITSVDFNIINQVYTFQISRLGHFYYYEKYYLPTTFVECILHFFTIKTTLKGVSGKEDEYMNGKENLNAIFGMCVTDIVRELIEYDNYSGWVKPEKKDDDEYMEYLSNQLEKENEKKSRFLFYLWGVFCTAYARKNLWTGIFECKGDYIYSDTDSVKIMNAKNHVHYFSNYNKQITEKLEAALLYHNLPTHLISPINIKGEAKHLGIWEFDGHYKKFKAVRAKSYMYLSDDDNDYHMTVSGLNKKVAMNYLKSKQAQEAFLEQHPDFPNSSPTPLDIFCEGLYIPPEHTGKLTHTYIDDEMALEVTDFQGITMVVRSQSFIHLEPASFEMSLSRAYRDYLNQVHTNEYI